MCWDNATIPMQEKHTLLEKKNDALFIQDPETTDAERIQAIIDAKYSPADLQKTTENCSNLDKFQKENLLKLLKKFQDLFDGSLDIWYSEPVSF